MDYNFDVADKTLFVTRGANMLHVASIRVSSPLAKAINSLRQRIAALEAEKAEREQQEPVGQVIGINTVQWKWHGPVLGAKLYAAPPIPRVEQEPVAWVLFDDIFIALKDMPDDPPNLECMKPLYAHPLAMREPTEDECSRIAIEAGYKLHTEAARIAIGRAMFNAVREVMTK